MLRSFGARDPEGGALTWQVSDDRFEVVQTGSISYQLRLKDGISLDFETEPGVSVTATATDPGGLSTSRTFNLAVSDGAPTAIALDNATVDENAVGAEIGSLTVTDPDGDTTFDISVDDDRFEVVDGLLKLSDGESLDFETEPTVTVAVTAAGDGSVFGFTETFEIMVNDVNEAPLVYRPTDAAESLVIDELIPAISTLDPELAEQLIQEFGNPRSENAPGTYFSLLVATDYTGNQLAVELSDSRFEPVPITEFIPPDTELPPQLEAELDAALGADWSTLYLVKLLVSEVIDYETEPTVSMTATATDASGTTSATLDFEVENVNEAPTAIALDNNPIDENEPGAVVGAVTVTDPDGDTAFDFLVDDARFGVVDGALKLVDGEGLDFEEEPTVSLNVTATDAGGLSVSESFDIDVADINEGPQIVRPAAIAASLLAAVLTQFPELGLAQVVIDPGFENTPGDTFGILQVSDPDGGVTVELSDPRFESVPIDELVTPGAEIPPELEPVLSGVYVVKLKENEAIDHEAEPNVTLTATATDAGNLTASTSFAVGVGDVNEAPTAITLAGDEVLDDTPGAVVGALSVTDPEDDLVFDFEVSDDRFEVVGEVLKLKDTESLDFGVNPTVALDVTATDPGGLSFTQAFVIDVIDVPEVAV